MAKTHHLAHEHFNPQNYQIVEYLDNQLPRQDVFMTAFDPREAQEHWDRHYRDWQNDFARAGFGKREDGSQIIPHTCDHCGATIRYVVVAKHQPTSKTVAFGTTCCQRLNFGDRSAIQRWLKARKEAVRSMKADAAKEAVEFLTRDVEFAKVFKAIFPILRNQVSDSTIPFIVVDICSKFYKYGKVSDAQRNAVVKIYTQHLLRQERVAEQKALEANAADAPEGRVTYTGKVVFTKYYASNFGPGGSTKMLVVGDDGSKVFCTIPSNAEVSEGCRVSFSAEFTRKQDDPKFAFGKRPTKLVVLGEPTPEVSYASIPESNQPF